MQRISTLPARRRWHGRGGLALARSGAWVCGERQQRVGGGHRPLRGSRAGDRFALTLISPALDEVDATQVRDRVVKASVRRELSPTSPDERLVANAIACAKRIRG
jgi:hypothetical protein